MYPVLLSRHLLVRGPGGLLGVLAAVVYAHDRLAAVVIGATTGGGEGQESRNTGGSDHVTGLQELSPPSEAILDADHPNYVPVLPRR
jgi:hypothetical protein